MERSEWVDKVFKEVFEEDKGKVIFRKEEGSMTKIVRGIYNSVSRKYLPLIKDRDILMNYFINSLYDTLKVIKEVELGSEKGCEVFKRSLRSSIGFRIEKMIDSEREVKRMYIKELGEKAIVKLDSESLNSVKYDEVGIEERVEEEEELLNTFSKRLVENRGKYMTKHQLEVYDKLREDFRGSNQELRGVGYRNFSEYLEVKGYNRDVYNRFKGNVRVRVNRKMEEEGEIDNMKEEEKVIYDIVGVLEDEDIQEEELNFLIHLYISKSGDNVKLDEIVNRGLTTEEKVDVVKFIKSREGVVVEFKDGKIHGDEGVRYLTKRLLYKIVNNIYDVYETLEEEKVKTKENDVSSKDKGLTNIEHKDVTSVKAFNLTSYGYVPINYESR